MKSKGRNKDIHLFPLDVKAGRPGGMARIQTMTCAFKAISLAWVVYTKQKHLFSHQIMSHSLQLVWEKETKRK